MTTIQSNTQWDALSALTTKLFPQYGSRPAAFKAACAQRPDLARDAIDPAGAPVVQAAGAGTAQAPPATPAAADPLMRAIERLSAAPAPLEVSGPEGSPIVKACEALAARAVTARSTEPRGDRLGAVDSALDPSQSAVVRACEARAASSSQGR